MPDDSIVDYSTLPPPDLPPHLPAEVNPMPFVNAFYSNGCSPGRQNGIVLQLRETLTKRGCRLKKGVTVRTDPATLQRALDQIVNERDDIRAPDRAIVVLLLMLHNGKVNLDLNAKGETRTEAAAAVQRDAERESDAIHAARRARAAKWAKAHPEQMRHIEFTAERDYGASRSPFRQAAYEAAVLSACLREAGEDNGVTPHAEGRP